MPDRSIGGHLSTPLLKPNPSTMLTPRPLSPAVSQMVGDELRLKLDSASARVYGKSWEGSGHVLRIGDGEVALEMRNNIVPVDITEVRLALLGQKKVGRRCLG